MKKGYTHITVILDRTGSMEAIRDDVIGGFNAFLADQKALPSEATLTLVQFDSEDPFEVRADFAPLAEVPELTRATYVPRASTPLWDALGRGISVLGSQLAGLKAEEQPESTVIVVITDGRENSSCEFNRERVRGMIEEKQKAGWQFVFLSADLDSFDDARRVGFLRSSTLAFDKTSMGNTYAWQSLSERLCDVRSGLVEEVCFTLKDRERQAVEKERE